MFGCCLVCSHGFSWTLVDSLWRCFSQLGGALCIKLLGGGLLVSRAGGLPLPQVVTALVLLPHAVDEQEDEEDGEQEADHAACNYS